MYDLNLSVPNITSPKYSSDNRFLLLKNYLQELNETLSFALADRSANEIISLKCSSAIWGWYPVSFISLVSSELALGSGYILWLLNGKHFPS